MEELRWQHLTIRDKTDKITILSCREIVLIFFNTRFVVVINNYEISENKIDGQFLKALLDKNSRSSEWAFNHLKVYTYKYFAKT